MRRVKLWTLCLGLCLYLVSGCDDSQEQPPGPGEQCNLDRECEEGLICLDWFCIDMEERMNRYGPSGVWTDVSTGLMWQNPPSFKYYKWNAAEFYCGALSLAGFSDWRLPSITELRTIIRDCPWTEWDSGTNCAVGDGCLSKSCYDSESCRWCPDYEGTSNGCYWPDEMLGPPCPFYWSSSRVDGDAVYAWGVSYFVGLLLNMPINSSYHVRCVR